MATWFDLIVKTPDRMKATTSAPISILTMLKLLRSASDKASALASSAPCAGPGAAAGCGAPGALVGSRLEPGGEASLSMSYFLTPDPASPGAPFNKLKGAVCGPRIR